MVGEPIFTRDPKVARAYKHIAAVKKMADDWLKTDAYTIARDIDPTTGHTICTARIQAEPPSEIGLIVGDAIHNLRSALDHAIYAIAERHLGSPLPVDVRESLAFPIIGNQRNGRPADGAKLFRKAVTRLHRDGLIPANALRYIDSIQPYRWAGEDFRYHWLWRVHELDRIDKHRHIHVATAWLSLPYVSSPGDPRALEIQWRHRGDAPVRDGEVVLTFSGAEDGVDAHFSRGVAIHEGPLVIGQEVGDLLGVLARQIEVYVACLTGEIQGPADLRK